MRYTDRRSRPKALGGLASHLIARVNLQLRNHHLEASGRRAAASAAVVDTGTILFWIPIAADNVAYGSTTEIRAALRRLAALVQPNRRRSAKSGLWPCQITPR